MRFIILSMLMFGLISCEREDASVVGDTQDDAAPVSRVYRAMRNADYRELTGCERFSYDASIHAALSFLVFDESSDANRAAYARRHTRPHFQSFQTEGRTLDTACLPSWLRDIGQDMDILEPAGLPEGEANSEFTFDADATNFPDDGITWEVMSRAQYMDATECLLSPASYEKFHGAIHDFLYTNWPDRAPSSLASFLADVRSSRPLDDGSLDPACLTPGLLALGLEMGVLDEAGKIAAEFQSVEE